MRNGKEMFGTTETVGSVITVNHLVWVIKIKDRKPMLRTVRIVKKINKQINDWSETLSNLSYQSSVPNFKKLIIAPVLC
jgi:alpha-galactosidase/6-phospho-beta-glucosidase family protein